MGLGLAAPRMVGYGLPAVVYMVKWSVFDRLLGSLGLLEVPLFSLVD
jgi:hypothetical protein